MGDREKELAALALQAAHKGVAMHRENLCAAGDSVSVDEQQRLALQLGESLKHEADAVDRVGRTQ